MFFIDELFVTIMAKQQYPWHNVDQDDEAIDAQVRLDLAISLGLLRYLFGY